VFLLVNATTLWAYDGEDDDWFQSGSPALTGTFGAGAGAVLMPSASMAMRSSMARLF
jgi:hypothetical protein